MSSLTHGEDYLTNLLSTSFAETPQQVNFDSITNVDEAIMYHDLVRPVLEAKCYSCHSSSKQKGQLRLDGPEFITKGGKHGDVVTAGVPDSSALYHRLTLPVEDKKHMPPEEKPQLSSAEIDIIRSWVSDGYSFDKKVSAYKDRDRIREFVAVIQSLSEQKSWVPSKEVSAASEKALQPLQEKAILVMPVAQESNYLMANFVNARASTDKELELLVPLKDQLIWLNVEKTRISDTGMETISKLSNLRILYLNNTAITDEGIQKLESLQDLAYLNLVGTGFSDRSLNTLRKLRKLESLYVFDTKVSKDSVRNFIHARGNLRTDTGRYSIPFLITDTLVFKSKP
jgi:mono/diheme cytochrome c family protein